MRIHRQWPRGFLAAAALLTLTSLAPAFPQSYANPPGRVAQLSDIRGSVSLEPAGTTSWTAASLNRPITIGDKIWDDRQSRAELDIGDAVIRLASMTGFSFLNLDQNTAQMQVTAGTAIVHVRSLGSGESDEIDSPNIALTLEEPGTYRVDVSDTGDATVVEVMYGKALVSGGGQTYTVGAQQAVTFMGTNPLSVEYETLGAPDAFDDWSMARDREEAQAAALAQQYVSPSMVGADQLGAYGTWQYTAGWGYAWFPTVAAGWAPYSYGNWMWISPWGWTWDDDEPWGFAPFHYGRWADWDDRWCWVPGPRFDDPIYAPALVGWIGAGFGGPFGAYGNVGWFPLGPQDVYYPAYDVSPGYVRDINLTNSRRVRPGMIRDIGHGRMADVHFGNRRVPGAITAVPRRVFTSGEPVTPHRLAFPRSVLTRFHPSAVAPAIVPDRRSVLGWGGRRIVRAPPRALIDRPVVARRPPPRGPVSFAREVAAIRANGGRPLPVDQLARMRPFVPAAPVRLARPGVVAPRVFGPGVARPGAQFRAAQRPFAARPYQSRAFGRAPVGRAAFGRAPAPGARARFAPQYNRAPTRFTAPPRFAPRAPVYRAPVYRAPVYRAPVYRASPPMFHAAPSRGFQGRPAPMPRGAPPPHPPMLAGGGRIRR